MVVEGNGSDDSGRGKGTGDNWGQHSLKKESPGTLCDKIRLRHSGNQCPDSCVGFCLDLPIEDRQVEGTRGRKHS